MLNALLYQYILMSGEEIRPASIRDHMDLPCRARYISTGSYGKFPEDDAEKNNLMEYS